MLKQALSSKLLRAVVLLVPITCSVKAAFASAPIAVSAVANLHFGSLVVGAGGGTATINTAGARSVGGTVTEVTGLSLQTQGQISVSGSTGLAIELTVLTTTYNIDNGGGDVMAVNNFNLVTNGGGTQEVITLTAPTVTYPVGARLNVAAAQAAGAYTGSYTIRANYQ